MVYLTAMCNKIDSLLSLQIYAKKKTFRLKQPQNPLNGSFQDRYEKKTRTDYYELDQSPTARSWGHTLHIHRLEDLISLFIIAYY